MQPANALLPEGGFDTEKLLAPEQAMVAYFSRVAPSPGGIERVPLPHALGRVLAQDIVADDDYPNADRSAMDGYAVRAGDTPGTLAVRDAVRMGSAPGTLQTGTAWSVPTGGMLPSGADAVVPIEECRVEGEAIVVERAFEYRENVVERGADMRRGELAIAQRTRIGAPQLGVLATLGVVDVPVVRRPVVAVLSTGDELVPPEQRPQPGQIRDSNRYAIAALLEAMGACAKHYPIVVDESEAFAAALARALDECDAVVLTGGSSVGERDRVPQTVAALSPGILVHGLRVKPGKPLLLGARGNTPILGLPGNPTSALMMLQAVAAPIVEALVGAPLPRGSVSARLAGPARSRPGWTWYLPVALRDEGGTRMAHPLPLRSFSVSLAARSGGYIVMDESAVEWPIGTEVVVHNFLGG